MTTKKGRSGKFHISYDGIYGFERVFKRLDMFDRNGYVGTAQALGLNYNDGGYDTDFQKAITRTGSVQHHHVAFGGGTDKSNYRASVGLMRHNMVVSVNSYHNFVAKLDVTQKAFDDRLSIVLGVNGSTQRGKDIFDDQLLFYSAAAHNPTFPNGPNKDGGWDKNSTASQITNPIALTLEQDHQKTLNFNTHIRLTYDIWPNLKVNAFAAYSFNSTEEQQYLPTWVWAQGQAYRSESKSEDWLGNLTAEYWWDFNDENRIELTGLAEYQANPQSRFFTTVKGFVSNDFGYDNLMAGSLRPYGGTGSSYNKPELLSFMGSAKYMLLHRYTFNFSIRTDGSNKVGENNQWGFFPSLSAEWDVMNEPFMKHVHAVSQLKVRVGAGLTGNLGGIDSFYSIERYKPTGIVPGNGMPAITLGYTHNTNPDLKWETRGTLNFGVDLGLFNNRLVLTAETYFSRTHDMLYLYDVSVPPFPFDKLLANLGTMSNTGFELGLGGTPFETRDMQLNVNLNLSHQKNKLVSLSGEYKGEYLSAGSTTAIGSLNGAGFHGGDNDIVYQIVGQPIGVFYLPHCTGIVDDGDGTHSYAIADLNEDGKADPGTDRYIAGQAMPKWSLGSNISFRYKDFDITLQMNGAFGHKIYNGTALTYMNMGSFPDYNVLTDAPTHKIYDQTATDYYLERGDYLNFDYLTVGWNLPIQRYTRFISQLRLALSVNNLATITSYSGLTPMINSYVVSNTLGLDDKRSYPPYRSYTLGVSVTF